MTKSFVGAGTASATTPTGDRLARLGGADLDLLARVPTARGKFIQMGLVLLSTAALAVVSMSFALADGLHVPVVAAVACGLGWGFIIINLDRLLIQNLDARGSFKRTFTMVLPRILMAALLGLAVSTPLVLRVFQSEIRAHIAMMNVDRQKTFGTAAAETAQAKELTQVKADIETNEKILRGDVPGIVTSDLTTAQDEVKTAQAALTQKRTVSDGLYRRMQCELYGSNCESASGRNGSGPLYQALKREYDVAVRETAQAERALTAAQQREAKAREASRADASGKVSQAQKEANAVLPGLRAKRDALQKTVDAQRANGSSLIQADDGILAQITALEDLGSKNPAARTAHWALGLLFFMIELLPVLVKMLTSMGAPSSYEQILDMSDRAVVDLAMIDRNDERRRIEALSKKNKAIEEDMLQREVALGRHANAHVAGEMEKILDLALLQWSQNVAKTLFQAGAATAGPSPSQPPPASATPAGSTSGGQGGGQTGGQTGGQGGGQPGAPVGQPVSLGSPPNGYVPAGAPPAPSVAPAPGTAFTTAFAGGTGYTPTPPTANGTAANGTAANGTAANGTAANGTAANGTAANGTASTTTSKLKATYNVPDGGKL